MCGLEFGDFVGVVGEILVLLAALYVTYSHSCMHSLLCVVGMLQFSLVPPTGSAGRTSML